MVSIRIDSANVYLLFPAENRVQDELWVLFSEWCSYGGRLFSAAETM